jgi:hypothetical protein
MALFCLSGFYCQPDLLVLVRSQPLCDFYSCAFVMSTSSTIFVFPLSRVVICSFQQKLRNKRYTYNLLFFGEISGIFSRACCFGMAILDIVILLVYLAS